jgi:hypothetical protein
MAVDRILIYRDGADLAPLVKQMNDLPGSSIIDPAENFKGEYTILRLHQFQTVSLSMGWILIALVDIVDSNQMYTNISFEVDEEAPVEYMQEVMKTALEDNGKEILKP